MAEYSPSYVQSSHGLADSLSVQAVAEVVAEIQICGM